MSDIPGINAGVYTERDLLHAANWMDFQVYVSGLLRQERLVEARQLWASVCHVIHLGSDPMDSIEGLDELPQVPRVPCVELQCQRCDSRRGGFKFPWLGLWTKHAALAQSSDTPASLWQRYHARSETMDLLAVQFHAAYTPWQSQVGMEDIMPAHLRLLVDRLAEGRDGVDLWQLFRLWRFWQAGKRRWQEPLAAFAVSPRLGGTLLQVGRAGTAIRSLLGAQAAHVDFIPELCAECWLPTRRRCPRCGEYLCDWCLGGETTCPCCTR